MKRFNYTDSKVWIDVLSVLNKTCSKLYMIYTQGVPGSFLLSTHPPFWGTPCTYVLCVYVLVFYIYGDGIDMMCSEVKCLVGVKLRWHRAAIMTNAVIAAGVLGWVVQSDTLELLLIKSLL